MDDNILDINLSKQEIKLVAATKGKRLANYIIDRFIFTAVAILFFAMLEFQFELGLENIGRIADYILTSVVLVTLYTIAESALKGKTVGKYITGTRVVMRETGEQPDLGTLISRSFSRVVPFEAFSFLGEVENGWHDKWSDTMVIDEKLSSTSDVDSWLQPI